MICWPSRLSSAWHPSSLIRVFAVLHVETVIFYALVICIHCSPSYGDGGIVTSHFYSPGISPTRWGQANGNNPTLSPALHYRKSHQGKCPNVNPPTPHTHFSGTAVTIKKVFALRHSPAIPPYPHRWGPWIQMTGALAIH